MPSAQSPGEPSPRARTAAAQRGVREGSRARGAGVPEILTASWERSLAAGVDVERPVTDFTEDIDTGSRLVRSAMPVIEQLRNDTSALAVSVAMADSQARVIVRVDTSSAVGRRLDHVEFSPGFNYAESAMGTNGVGTVLEAGRAVSVIGSEHFTENLRPFACTGTPIIDPLTGRVEGILDVSTLTESWSPLMPALVTSAAQRIARNLLLDRNQAQQALFEAYLRTDARSTRSAVLAFTDSLVMANAAAQALLPASEQATVREHAAFILGRRDEARDTITLASGTHVHLRCTRVVAGASTAGIVVTADVVALPDLAVHDPAVHDLARPAADPNERSDDGSCPIARPALRPILTPRSKRAQSPAWLRARQELSSALAAGQPLLVLGEAGTGKRTVIEELAAAALPHANVVVREAADLADADLDVADLADADLDDADLEAHGIRTICLLTHLDRATEATIAHLEEVLATAADPAATVSVVATLPNTSLERALPFQTLLPRFEASVTIPPLRWRTEDLDVIFDQLTAELAPGRRVTLSAAARRTLARHPWPGNLTQLREALTEALRTRPVGEISDQDLPSFLHSASTRTLTVLEAAERDTIVTALRDLGGNRAAAAKHLGMSRSSLYRKLRAYGITT